MQRIDARAWVIWLASSLAVLFLIDHPIVDLVVILAAGLVAASARGSSPFRNFLILGVVMLAVRTGLFALTGHTGKTTLFATPTLQLPGLLGGATLGGRVTAEVLLSSIAEAIRIVAVMACFGAFLTVTETIDLLRLLPRFLFEAGLVTTIAMGFAPQLSRSAHQIREAQSMRGERRRLAPTFVPMLATALEQSISLAESMDARGYGRAESDLEARRVWQRVSAAGSLALAGSASLWMLKPDSLAAGAATLLLTAVVAWSLSKLNRLVRRTRYRRDRFGRISKRVSMGAVLLALSALALAQSGAVDRFVPYRSLALIAPHPLAALVAAALVLPAFLVPGR